MESTLIDIRAELAAVQSAISHSRQQQSRLVDQIAATTDIGTLADLHDAWSEATEQLAAAEQRRAELVAALK